MLCPRTDARKNKLFSCVASLALRSCSQALQLELTTDTGVEEFTILSHISREP